MLPTRHQPCQSQPPPACQATPGRGAGSTVAGVGWCHAFGPQIRPGCDQPMVASDASCSCPHCGVVCPGRFRGCAQVWASGLQPPVLIQEHSRSYPRDPRDHRDHRDSSADSAPPLARRASEPRIQDPEAAPVITDQDPLPLPSAPGPARQDDPKHPSGVRFVVFALDDNIDGRSTVERVAELLGALVYPTSGNGKSPPTPALSTDEVAEATEIAKPVDDASSSIRGTQVDATVSSPAGSFQGAAGEEASAVRETSTVEGSGIVGPGARVLPRIRLRSRPWPGPPDT